MKTLQDAFEHTLHDMYYPENAITKALPKIIVAVSNSALKAALQHHLEETKGQIKTLDLVFKSIGKAPKGEKCDAIEGSCLSAYLRPPRLELTRTFGAASLR